MPLLPTPRFSPVMRGCAFALAGLLHTGSADAQDATDALKRQIIDLRRSLATAQRERSEALSERDAARQTPPSDALRQQLRELSARLNAALKERDDALRAAHRAQDDANAKAQERDRAAQRRIDDIIQGARATLERERAARRAAEQAAESLQTAQAEQRAELARARTDAQALRQAAEADRAAIAGLSARLQRAQTGLTGAQAAASAAASDVANERAARSAAETRLTRIEQEIAALRTQRWWWLGVAGALGLALGGALIRAFWAPKPVLVETPLMTPLSIRVTPGAWSVRRGPAPREAHAGFRLRTAWLPQGSSVRPERALVREVLRGPTRSAFP